MRVDILFTPPIGSMLLVWKCVCLVCRLCGCVKVVPWASCLSTGDGYMCGCFASCLWDYVSWYPPLQACMCVWRPAIAGYWCLASCYCGILVSGTPLLRDIGVWHPTVVGYWCLVPPKLQVGYYVFGTLPWRDILYGFGALPWWDVLRVFGTCLGRLCVSSVWHWGSVPCGFTNPTPFM